MRSIYAFIFKTLGWKTSGKLPVDVNKYILVVAPHTSNWDFLVGLGARAVLKFDPKYVAKKELFIWPLGYLFRKLGGYPVERVAKNDFVQSMVDIFESEERFILTITPEGTRKYAPKWKTGFFFIAQKAGVPILPVGFDYKTKTVHFGELKFAIGKVDEFIQDLQTWFSQFEGKIPSYGVLDPQKESNL